MSHFTVLVVGDNPEEQLAPYNEQSKDPKYTKFLDAEKEYRDEFELGTATRREWHPADNIWLTQEELDILKVDGKISFKNHAPDRYFCSGRLSSTHAEVRENIVRVDVWDEELGVQETDIYAKVSNYSRVYSEDIQKKLFQDFKKENPKDVEESWRLIVDRLAFEKQNFYVYTATLDLVSAPKNIPLNEIYSDFYDYLESWYGYEKNEDGTYGEWCNPNSKWDWYVLGGRWSGTFILKEGSFSDQAFKRDIDFEAMLEKQRERAEELWEETEDIISQDNEDSKWMLSFQYGREEKDTKESYIERSLGFSTFAVLKDGQWYEKGKRGWWSGVSDEKNTDTWEKELSKLLSDIPNNTLLSNYDCHI